MTAKTTVIVVFVSDQSKIAVISTMEDVNMNPGLGSFPTDEYTLTSVRHAVGSSLNMDDSENPVRVNGEYGLGQLLEFLSGVETEDFVVEDPTYGVYEVAFCRRPMYSETDLILALVTEIERLRGESSCLTCQTGSL